MSRGEPQIKARASEGWVISVPREKDKLNWILLQDTDLGMTDSSPGGLGFPTLRWGEGGSGGKGGGRGKTGGKRQKEREERQEEEEGRSISSLTPPEL